LKGKKKDADLKIAGIGTFVGSVTSESLVRWPVYR